MGYEKIIIALIQHFAVMEGTDYLGQQGEATDVEDLTVDENAELTRLRDIARKAGGWHGY